MCCACVLAVLCETWSSAAISGSDIDERRRLSTVMLVFDEPTSNMDQAGRREFAEALEPLDVTMLTITHDLSHALKTCPRAIVMNAGRVVADGPTVELLGDEQLLADNRLKLPYGLALASQRRSAA